MSRRKLSLEERRKVLETQPEVKWISIIDNNDEFAESRNHLIRMNQTKSMDNLLTDLTRSLKPNWGAVRNIYTPYGGTKVTALEQLETRKLYAVGGPKFKAINVGNRSKRSSWSNGHQSKNDSSENNSNRHSSESDRRLRRKRVGQQKVLSPDDDYNEYFKHLYERNKRIVTRNRRPLYENKHLPKPSRRRNDSNHHHNGDESILERSKSLNEIPQPKSRTPSPPIRKDSPPAVLQHQDSMDIRKNEERSSARSRDSARDRNSGGSVRSFNERGSVRSFHERGTFVNNSERDSGRSRRSTADRPDSLHFDHRSDTRVQSNSSLHRRREGTPEEEVKYFRRSPDNQSRRGTPPQREDSRTRSQYERVLSGLSRLSTTRTEYESKDEGESAKSFAIRQMDSGYLWKQHNHSSSEEVHPRFAIS